MTNTRDEHEMQPDGDPRLTAYALGELDEAERAEVEALLLRDADARAEVAAVRETADALRAEFAVQAAGESVPALTPAQRAMIESAARVGPVEPVRAVRRAALVWLWPAAAAAGLLAWVVWDNRAELAGRPRLAADAPVAKDESGQEPAARSAEVDRLAQLPYLGSTAREETAVAPDSAESLPVRMDVEPEVNSGAGHHPAAEAPVSPPADSVVSALEAEQGELPPEMQDLLSALGYMEGGGGGAAAPRANPGGAGAPTTGAAAAAGPLSSAPSATLARRTRLEEEAVFASALGEPLAMAESADDRAAPVFRYLRVSPGTPGTELYVPIVEQGFQSPWAAPFSTFGVDVDTASYSNVRRFLNNGQLPPVDAVRLEELVNYFRYDDPGPAPGAECPFGVTVDVTDCPWAPGHRLARVALKGREVPVAQRTSSNLVFLLDVSGSMSDQDKLPLLVASMKLFTQQLDERDRVAIVTYAGAAGLVLDSTTCDDAGRRRVLDALDRLSAGGSTAGAAGIQLAYQVAAGNFRTGGTNRVILATDGDFNVGITDRTQLQDLIEQSARTGVFLTVLGFGEGNLKDGTAELLADKGNGQYCYIDSLDEGRRVMVQQMAGTLLTIAKDVKLQVEFNPAQVEAYRLVGYENRALAPQDFKDDRKDAGDIGAGHSVVALYELVPPGAGAPGVDPPRYQKPADAPRPELVSSDELLTVKLRWKEPAAATSTETAVSVRDGGGTLASARPDVKFSAAVAAFGLLLRGSDQVTADRNWLWTQLIALADAARGADPDGRRAEFVRLSRSARDLQGMPPQQLTEEQIKLLKALGYIRDGDDQR